MILRFVSLTVFGVFCVAPVLAESYKIDTAHSSITFKVRQFINTTNGRFRNFSGTIQVDREHPENSSVSVKIAVSSIDTNIRKRDDHLLSAEFFDAAKYPEITFKSRSVKQTGPQSGDITWDFTMHGVTKPIVLHVKLAGDLKSENTRWEVTTEPLNRKEFNLMFSSGAEAVSGISQQVTPKIEIVASRAP